MSNQKGLKENSLKFLLSDSGLDDLLNKDDDLFVEKESEVKKNKTQSGNSSLSFIAIDKITPCPYQPRRVFNSEKIQDLANSIKQQGVLQPIVLRPAPSGDMYEIIAGERRWRASQIAGLIEIPAVVKDISNQAALASAIVENIQREDLNPLEEARGLQRLIDEFDLTQTEVSDTVGKSRSTVTNLLRLLTLVPAVQKMVENGDIDMGHARALISLEDSDQLRIAKWIVAHGASVRETEKAVQQCLEPRGILKVATQTIDPNIKNLQDDLSQKLAAEVKITHQNSGKGILAIKYHNVDELEGILSRIN